MTEVRGDEKPIRAFFAVEVGDAGRREAAGLIAALRAAPGGERVGWVRPENLHVTLRFLGDVEPRRLPDLVTRVREETSRERSLQLSLGTLGWLSGRVIFLEVAPAEPLAALAGAVERGVVAAGFPPEARPFRAHLTLGRLRGGRRPAVTSAVTAGGDAFGVNEVVLFQSRLRPSGAKYTPLERIGLGG